MNLIKLLDGPIAFQRCFVELTGSITGALLLSQAVYWQNRCKTDDGFWWKTQEQWTAETGMSRHELDSARKACKAFLISDRRGAPAKTWYKVDADQLEAAVELQQSSLPDSGNLKRRKVANCTAGNRQSPNISETTSDILPSQPVEPVLAEPAKEVTQHIQFVELWTTAYKVKFGLDYIFSGGKDGQAVKRLLTTTRKTPVELMAIVGAAWQKTGRGFWACEKLITICFFSSQYNQIQNELKCTISKSSSGGYGRPVASRNTGTLNKPSDYEGIESTG